MYGAVYSKNVRYSETFTTGGTKYTVLWVGETFELKIDFERLKIQYKESDLDKYVNAIYIIPNMESENRNGSVLYSMKQSFIKPIVNVKKYWTVNEAPRVDKIILHEPNGNSASAFVGARVYCRFINDPKDVIWGNLGTWEIRLPDDVANRMMDLVKGRTKFKVIPGSDLDKIFGGSNMGYSTSNSLEGVRIRQ